MSNDVFEARRILWRIKGEHICQLKFQSSMPNEQNLMFHEVIVGDIPRMTWTQSHRALSEVSNGAEIGRLAYSIDWLELNRSALTQNAVLFATVVIFVLGLLLLSNVGAIKTLFHMERSISEINKLVEAGEFDAIQSKIQDQVRALPAGGIGMPFAELTGRLVDTVQRASHLENELRLSKAVSVIATQVAHDIRSPLAALDSVLKDLSQLPEEKRIMIRGAVGRIRDIANHLLEKNRAASAQASTAHEVPLNLDSAQLVSSLVESLITEKRLQFRSQLDVEIDASLDASSYGLFVAAPPFEFMRVISNTINNAVEALPDKGLVTVRLASSGDNIAIHIRDNGKGIPSNVLARLGQRGETHGKPGGSGLGLYHAKTSVESWGGSLTIDSEPGKGTTVTIHLPRARPPAWFVSGLAVPPGTSIIVLDDDASIHQIWQGRFESAHIKDHAVEVRHFSTPDELRSWAQMDARTAKDPLYLMDYELTGYRETGLSLAEELGIGARTILVTSRFEEKGVLDDLLRIKARLIPKSLAGFVPIHIGGGNAPERFDAVLIDDDPLTRMNWKMEAARSGKKFQSFSTAAEFFKEAPLIGIETPIYIDAKLADGANGAQESLKIHELGFQEIYLATGHEAARFAAFQHLRGVVGKDPPWDYPVQ